MKRIVFPSTLALAALLAACMHQFTRPAQDALTLGKTQYADVIRLLGKPTFENDKVSVNGVTIKTVDYYVYSQPRTVLHNAPRRYLHCSFLDGVLVGEEYNSSYEQDSTRFDPDKARALVIGASTREDVIAALGQPSGEILYPLVKDRNGSGLVYWHTLYFHQRVGYTTESFRLVVFFDLRGVVSDISYKGSDGKEQFSSHVTSRLSEQPFDLSPITY